MGSKENNRKRSMKINGRIAIGIEKVNRLVVVGPRAPGRML